MPDVFGTMKNRWPSDFEEPYWNTSQLLRDDIDKRMRANYEDKDLLIVGGAPFSLTGNTFTWGTDLYIVSPRGGKALRVPAGNIVVADGSFLYVASPSRFITVDAGAAMQVSGVALDLDVDKILIGVRRGTRVHLARNDDKLPVGGSLVFGASASFSQAVGAGGSEMGNMVLPINEGMVYYVKGSVTVGSSDDTNLKFGDASFAGAPNVLYEIEDGGIPLWNPDVDGDWIDRNAFGILGLTGGKLYWELINNGANPATYSIEIRTIGKV